MAKHTTNFEEFLLSAPPIEIRSIPSYRTIDTWLRSAQRDDNIRANTGFVEKINKAFTQPLDDRDQSYMFDPDAVRKAAMTQLQADMNAGVSVEISDRTLDRYYTEELNTRWVQFTSLLREEEKENLYRVGQKLLGAALIGRSRESVISEDMKPALQQQLDIAMPESVANYRKMLEQRNAQMPAYIALGKACEELEQDLSNKSMLSWQGFKERIALKELQKVHIKAEQDLRTQDPKDVNKKVIVNVEEILQKTKDKSVKGKVEGLLESKGYQGYTVSLPSYDQMKAQRDAQTPAYIALDQACKELKGKVGMFAPRAEKNMLKELTKIRNEAQEELRTQHSDKGFSLEKVDHKVATKVEKVLENSKGGQVKEKVAGIFNAKLEQTSTNSFAEGKNSGPTTAQGATDASPSTPTASAGLMEPTTQERGSAQSFTSGGNVTPQRTPIVPGHGRDSERTK